MKNVLWAVYIVFECTACSSPSLPKQEGASSEKALVNNQLPPSTTLLPRTYWSLDTTVQRSDTVLRERVPYHIRIVTTCLNDSAVVNPITLQTGPALDVSHNYQSDLYISRGQQPWLHERLTKALFRQNALVQTLGSLQELALSRTAFLTYQHGEFRFTTCLGVPDSDIFVEAEVAVIPEQGLQVVKVQQPEDGEQ